MDMNLSKLQEIVKERKPGKLQSMELKMSDTTELTNNTDMNTNSNLMAKLWGKIPVLQNTGFRVSKCWV